MLAGLEFCLIPKLVWF